jgi:hypothetical protein
MILAVEAQLVIPIAATMTSRLMAKPSLFQPRPALPDR